WDLPVAVEAAGGWLTRDTAHLFGDYTAAVAERLADRVHHWYTINEPASTSLQGYALAELAPGHTMLCDALPTVPHPLLAHGLAAGTLDSILNRLFADPLILGTYPDLTGFGVEMPVADGDMELISTPNEVYGFNYYNPITVRAAQGPLPFEMVPTPGAATTGFGPMWPIRPDTIDR